MAKTPLAFKRGVRLAVMGSDTLLGREVREQLETAVAGVPVKFLPEVEEAPELAVKPAEMAQSTAVILAGSPNSSRKAYELIQRDGPGVAIVDATGVLEDNPAARLRAPQAETARPDAGKLHVIAHPAAIALAVLLRRLQGVSPIRRCVVVVFEPASERGQPGLDELQQQTAGLLSFQKLKKAVYDAQVSFNLLPAYGEDAPKPLEEIELTIDRHLASLLSTGGGATMPSLRVIQAPVFHGYSFSLWVEFEQNPGVEAIGAGLKSNHIEVRGKDEEAPTNVGATGQSGITVGAIAEDRNHPRACWLWAVADNLRIAADSAVEVAREFLG